MDRHKKTPAKNTWIEKTIPAKNTWIEKTTPVDKTWIGKKTQIHGKTKQIVKLIG